jgi:hypothetical protein
MAKGIIKQLHIVRENLRRQMCLPRDAGKYERGFRSEGYLGGYRQAIDDVELALRGSQPTTRDLWNAKGNDDA